MNLNLDWILSPITSYAVIALALVSCLAVYISNRSEMWRLRRSANASQQELQRKIEQMEAAVSEMKKQPKELPLETVVRPATIRPSLNLTRRTQALRMRRRGESVESIAAALSTPRNEIELLLKVYEMLDYRRQIKGPAEPAA